MDSQVDWKGSGLQHHGRQATDELSYIMESRPERGLHLFMRDEPPPTASGSSGATPSSGRCDILRKQLWKTSLRCKSFGMTSTVRAALGGRR